LPFLNSLLESITDLSPQKKPDPRLPIPRFYPESSLLLLLVSIPNINLGLVSFGMNSLILLSRIFDYFVEKTLSQRGGPNLPERHLAGFCNVFHLVAALAERNPALVKESESSVSSLLQSGLPATEVSARFFFFFFFFFFKNKNKN